MLVKEAEAEKLATQRVMKEISKNPWERRDLRTVQESPDEKLEAGTPPISIENANIHVSDCQKIKGMMEVIKTLPETGMIRLCFHCHQSGHLERTCPNKATPQSEERRKAQLASAQAKERDGTPEECWNPASGYLRGRGTGCCLWK